MARDEHSISDKISATGVLGRFAHLLSAQGVEGIVQTIFFLYLAWVNAELYGELMYAISVAAIVLKLVQFGLYYPLVGQLTKAPPGDAPELMTRVNVVKVILLGVSMIGVCALIFYQGFTQRMGWIVFWVSLGFGLEVLVDTLFAYFRVQGLQKTEARIRMASSVSSYGFGIVTAGLGFHPIIVGCFKLVSFGVRSVLGVTAYLRAFRANLWKVPRLNSVWGVFQESTLFAGIQILGTFYNKTNVLFLQHFIGVTAVAYYSATYSLVDAISMLASEQLLGWVVFPFLSVLWREKRDGVAPMVRRTALWLLAIAFPIMFFLAMESELIIGLIYPPGFKDAVWMQKYLVWTMLFSFQTNLFSYVMMVAGKVRFLFGMAVAATALNLLFNVGLVNSYGLAGGCAVIIFTKMVMTILTATYCQILLRLFKLRDFVFPILSALISLGLFVLIEPALTVHGAVAVTLGFYGLILWQWGERFLGRLSDRQHASDDNSPQRNMKEPSVG